MTNTDESLPLNKELRLLLQCRERLPLGLLLQGRETPIRWSILGASVVHLGLFWAPSGVCLGSIRGPSGIIWCHFGVHPRSEPFWSPSGVHLESSGGTSGVILGSCWGHPGATLGLSWHHPGVQDWPGHDISTKKCLTGFGFCSTIVCTAAWRSRLWWGLWRSWRRRRGVGCRCRCTATIVHSAGRGGAGAVELDELRHADGGRHDRRRGDCGRIGGGRRRRRWHLRRERRVRVERVHCVWHEYL